jgi:trehalose-6-phosphatase
MTTISEDINHVVALSGRPQVSERHWSKHAQIVFLRAVYGVYRELLVSTQSIQRYFGQVSSLVDRPMVESLK